jgi:hypothetical protein
MLYSNFIKMDKCNLKTIRLSDMLSQINSKYIFFLVALLASTVNAYSQNYKVTGKIIDNGDKLPVIGAYVFLFDAMDTTNREATVSDANGKFTFSNLKKKPYILSISSINYVNIKKNVELSGTTTDLGTMYLDMESKILQEVVITGQGTAVQKGDTTTMKADAFKVNVDANAEDLVKKMPGITVENGTVKARGENVQEVLVDGKPFFGDDPSVALRNLPADVIDRVQVYNRLNDQAELTGFDDGESIRTINIITRKGSKISQFGKITGGTDFNDKYLAAGSLNIFKGPRRFTFTGMTNNINQQNFAMQDLIGSSSGGGGFNRGGGGSFGGRSFGGSSGISKSSSAGINYQDNWGKKIAVSASYFFNTTANTRVTNSNVEYIGLTDGNFYSDSSYNESKNNNHRFNMRLEYQIDSLNSVIIVPRFSYQDNSADNNALSLITGGSVNSQTLSSSGSDADGYNAGNELTWRHKFMKPGRTLSVRNSTSYDKRISDNLQLALIDTVRDDQYADALTDNLSINTNLSYTEPIGKHTQLQLSLSNNIRKSNNSTEIFEVGDESEILGRLDSLSNVYDNNYITNSGGLSYLFKKNKLNLSAGVNYQRADLKGTQTFPQKVDVSKRFENWLPNVMVNYKFSDITNLRFFYRTSTNAPSVTDLQNAIDNSDRRRIRTGNPHLKQEYTHMIMSNFSYANPTTGFNSFIFLNGSYTNDVITNKTIYAGSDTLYQPEGANITLYPGGQLTLPVNLDHSYRLNTMINLSYFLKPIKSNISMVIGGGYSRSPESTMGQINNPKLYSLTNSLIITSNISANVDFTLSYTSNYSYVRNSLDFLNDTKYWYQSASAKLNLVLWKGITFNTDVLGQSNSGLSEGYNQKYLVWNASVGKKFLKNQAAEIKIGAYDILDQSKSITRTVTASQIRDTRVNTYRRYFLVLFTYNLRANRAQSQQPQQQQQQNDHGPGFPGGMPPGGMPPGGMPPGARPGGMPGGMPGGGPPHNF